eukprot:scaffold115737_cov66-Phaeocystis_antarctica.AAC.4
MESCVSSAVEGDLEESCRLDDQAEVDACSDRPQRDACHAVGQPDGVLPTTEQAAEKHRSWRADGLQRNPRKRAELGDIEPPLEGGQAGDEGSIVERGVLSQNMQRGGAQVRGDECAQPTARAGDSALGTQRHPMQQGKRERVHAQLS